MAHLAALLGVLLIIASVEHALFWLTAPPREIHLAWNFKQPAYQAGRVVPPTCLYTDPSARRTTRLPGQAVTYRSSGEFVSCMR